MSECHRGSVSAQSICSYTPESGGEHTLKKKACQLPKSGYRDLISPADRDLSGHYTSPRLYGVGVV